VETAAFGCPPRAARRGFNSVPSYTLTNAFAGISKAGHRDSKMPLVSNDSEPYHDVYVVLNQPHTFIPVAISERTISAQISVFDSGRNQNGST
jgi:hypothetical protein